MSAIHPFLSSVRAGKIPQPTGRKFSPERWREHAAKYAPLGPADLAVFEAGLWFFSEFEELRSALRELQLDQVPRRMRLCLAVAAMNRDYREVMNQFLAAARTAKDGVVNLSEAMKVGNIGPYKIEMPADDIITSVIDLSRLVLADALMAREPTQPSDISDSEVMRRTQAMIIIANVYEVLQTDWQAVLWAGYRLEKQDDNWLLIPQDELSARATAAWAFRQQQRSLEAAHNSARLVKGGILAVATAPRTIVGVKHSQTGIELIVGARSEAADRRPIETSIALMADDFLMGENVPRFGRDQHLDLPLLISAWGVLHDLVAALHTDKLDTNVETTAQLLAHAPELIRHRLVAALAASLEIAHDRADAVVEFLTFDPARRGGLWGHPVVKLSDDAVLIAAPSIVSGNAIRAIEHWLRAGKVSFSERGIVVEQEVREIIFQALEKSRLLKNVASTKSSVTIAGEEIDVLIRIGRRLIVGETKCSVFPSEPVELHNYLIEQIDGTAIPQAIRKAKAVSNNLDEAAKHFGLGASDFEAEFVTPLVIVNHAMGTGLMRAGVPICNTDFLERYFRDGRWGFHYVMTSDSPGEPALQVDLYTSETEAESDCVAHFSRHPAMLVLLDKCVLTTRPIPLASGGGLYFVHFALAAHPTLEETKQFFFGDLD